MHGPSGQFGRKGPTLLKVAPPTRDSLHLSAHHTLFSTASDFTELFNCCHCLWNNSSPRHDSRLLHLLQSRPAVTMPFIHNSTAQLQADLLEERRRLHHEADVVIVGAGIAGCSLAVALGNQGRSVILLEKSLKEPDRIVGELLQPGGVRALEKLGIRGMSIRS
jgi:hypothetical protein